jgi:hypothetical protein
MNSPLVLLSVLALLLGSPVRSVLLLMTFISEVATLIWLEGDPLFN